MKKRLLMAVLLAAVMAVFAVPAFAQTPTPIVLDVSATGIATGISNVGLGWVIGTFIFMGLVLYVIRKFVRR